MAEPAAGLPTGQASEGVARQRLCEAGELVEGGQALVFDVLDRGRLVSAFVLRAQGKVVGYLNRCAHVPAPMDWQPGEFLDAERRFIVCSIHGATYEPADGRCVGGPCGSGRLTALRVQQEGEQVYWYPSATIEPVAFIDPAPPADPSRSP